MTDYERRYNDHFKRVIESPDGTINKDALMRELSDYLILIENVPLVYSYITNGRISRPFCDWNTVVGEYERSVTDDIDDAIEDFKGRTLCDRCRECEVCS